MAYANPNFSADSIVWSRFAPSSGSLTQGAFSLRNMCLDAEVTSQWKYTCIVFRKSYCFTVGSSPL